MKTSHMTRALKEYLNSGDENRLLTLAVILSLTGHVLLFTVSHLLTTSGYKPHKLPRSIDVDLVQAELPTKKQTKSQPPAATPSKKAAHKKDDKKVQRPITKTVSGQKALKRNQKVVTPEELVQSALQKMAQETSKPEPLSQRLNRLKKEVADQKKPRPNGSKTGDANAPPTATQISTKERYYRTIEVIIRKNWAFPTQMAGANAALKTQIFFTVMPEGSVRDVWVAQRSGNANFDRSALSAVHKSTPLPPYPAGINDKKLPFVINFDVSELL
jgi:TonB family protein